MAPATCDLFALAEMRGIGTQLLASPSRATAPSCREPKSKQARERAVQWQDAGDGCLTVAWGEQVSSRPTPPTTTAQAVPCPPPPLRGSPVGGFGVSPDITPRGPREAEGIRRAVHGRSTGAALGELGHVPGVGPEDGHASPAKSNSRRGQEWGGSRAEEPGLKSLPTGLPVPPGQRPPPPKGGWQ